MHRKEAREIEWSKFTSLEVPIHVESANFSRNIKRNARACFVARPHCRTTTMFLQLFQCTCEAWLSTSECFRKRKWQTMWRAHKREKGMKSYRRGNAYEVARQANRIGTLHLFFSPSVLGAGAPQTSCFRRDMIKIKSYIIRFWQNKRKERKAHFLALIHNFLYIIKGFSIYILYIRIFCNFCNFSVIWKYFFSFVPVRCFIGHIYISNWYLFLYIITMNPFHRLLMSINSACIYIYIFVWKNLQLRYTTPTLSDNVYFVCQIYNIVASNFYIWRPLQIFTITINSQDI